VVAGGLRQGRHRGRAGVRFPNVLAAPGHASDGPNRSTSSRDLRCRLLALHDADTLVRTRRWVIGAPAATYWNPTTIWSISADYAENNLIRWPSADPPPRVQSMTTSLIPVQGPGDQFRARTLVDCCGSSDKKSDGMTLVNGRHPDRLLHCPTHRWRPCDKTRLRLQGLRFDIITAIADSSA